MAEALDRTVDRATAEAEWLGLSTERSLVTADESSEKVDEPRYRLMADRLNSHQTRSALACARMQMPVCDLPGLKATLPEDPRRSAY